MSNTPERRYLEIAYRRISTPMWPSLDDALRDTIKGKILLSVAKRIAARPEEPARGKPSTSPENPRPPVEYKPPPLDRKRLAAGERGDD
jgi:hypothetical protein